MDLELKLNATGTPREVIHALKRVIKNLEGASTEELEEFRYEDATAYAEAKLLESYAD